ncbi:hypothetical protein FK513_31285, partial [Klebsiella pneumoniae]|nr:hypothetical protein [Klebsiella pneumoniae]
HHARVAPRIIAHGASPSAPSGAAGNWAKQSLRLSQEVSLQAGLQQERQLFSLLSATEDRVRRDGR